MNVLLWILQVVLGVYFFITGIVHFIVPPGLPAPMAWMYELPPALHYLSGTAEILAGLGLILPGLTRIQTRLTPLAALGLVLVMLGAAVWHFLRNEFPSIFMNLILAGLAGFVAYGRWRLSPLKDRGS
ncbi:DoxX family protein [Thermoflexus sp.]|uniref:DoxX family protein n=1 Tax=Thermoflexus sp. TaxID=1969742 RepID=UPI0025FFC112|nr:DoxX family protein [Thermoflexus sp.]MDW8180755.1 DoxX family protein [Anaerolineae bacterium]MCS6965015.1 DoxX family protein [Thermoflexus sp.]MCS7351300.1 DoxX family protein [Thermoflexus sp.]MCX7691040.1 DoxX family protein [Thermoflexus sp.]MDW8185660.1 DoxX family protein [Anaerolineae bacterium]